MFDQKFLLPNQFFKVTPRLVVSAVNFKRLEVIPNFNNTFFFSQKLLGSAVSCYRQALESHFGFYTILHVKGIGFKVFYFARLHALYFSLGYNHVVKYKLPREVVVKVRKQYLLFFSYSRHSLGNSIYQIQHLRFPDPYRGKGIRFRFQVIVFKPGKQR